MSEQQATNNSNFQQTNRPLNNSNKQYHNTRVHGLAIASLIFGILSWLFLPIIGSIVAIITGHIGISKINRNIEIFKGKGMAIAGLVLGYLSLLLLSLLLVAIVVPAYKNYVVRTKIVEVMVQLEGAKVEVEAELSDGTSLQDIDSEIAPFGKTFLDSIVIEDGVITGTIKNAEPVPEKLYGKTIILTPKVDGGEVMWDMQNDMHPRYLPARYR